MRAKSAARRAAFMHVAWVSRAFARGRPPLAADIVVQASKLATAACGCAMEKHKARVGLAITSAGPPGTIVILVDAPRLSVVARRNPASAASCRAIRHHVAGRGLAFARGCPTEAPFVLILTDGLTGWSGSNGAPSAAELAVGNHVAWVCLALTRLSPCRTHAVLINTESARLLHFASVALGTPCAALVAVPIPSIHSGVPSPFGNLVCCFGVSYVCGLFPFAVMVICGRGSCWAAA